MGLTVRRNKTRTVDGKNDVFLEQIHIMDDLIVRTLQEGRVDADHRQHPLTGQTCRKGDGVLLCHADIKETIPMAVVKELQAGAVLHGSSDGADLLVGGSFFVQDIAKHRGEGLLGSHFRVGKPLQIELIELGNTVIVARVVFGRLIALALGGDNVQKMRAGLVADVAQCALQFRLVVAIHRAIVIKAHILEHGRMIHGAAHQLFAVADGDFQRRADHGNAVQEGADVLLRVKISIGGAQMVEVTCQRTDIFGNGHLVVVQDHDQVVQMADVVHALVDHTARERTIADDGDDLARFSAQLFGPRNANGQRKSRVAMACNKGVVLALIGVGETRNAVDLTQLRKALFAAGQQFVGVALMSHIKYDLIFGRFQHPMERDRQLDCAEVRGQMTARFGNIIQQKFPNFFAECFHLSAGQLFQITGLMDLIQQRRIHKSTSFSKLFFRRPRLPAPLILHQTHGIEEADDHADHNACHNLKRCMPHHLFQVQILQQRRVLFADVDPLLDHLVQHLGLLAGLIPDTHGVVHRDDGQHAGNCKNRRSNAFAARRCDDHSANGRAVGTGHTAVAPHPLQLKFPEQNEIDDRLEHLRSKPAQQRHGQDLIHGEKFSD